MDQHRRRRTISSSLGQVDLGEPQRVLSVEDPTADEYGYPAEGEIEDIEDIEQEVRQQRIEQQRPRAERKAINRLELLTGIGRLTTEITIEKVKFSLKSLKSKELRDVMVRTAMARSTSLGEALLIRGFTLAYSLFEIDDNPIGIVLGIKPEEELEAKIALIDDMDETVITAIWAAYSKMMNENNKTVQTDLGNEPKEIVDNIKKS
jgi:hypothetical protein